MATVINEKFGSVLVEQLQEHPRNPRVGNVEATQESIERNGFYGAIAGGLEGTGYDDQFLANLAGDQLEVPEDEPPAAPAKPTAKAGDLWKLGQHRLVCGDATIAADVMRATDGMNAELLLTDPPYNVAIAQHDLKEAKALRKRTDGKSIVNDEMSVAAFDSFLAAAFSSAASAMKAGGAAYVFHADSAGETFRRTFGTAGFDLKQVLIWVKQVFVMGRQDYQWQHEPILYGWKPGAAHRWYGAFDKATVIDHEKPVEKMNVKELRALVLAARKEGTVIRHDRPTRSLQHPTMKPVGLCARLMANSTRAGDLVLDPFGGSGSTLIAAEHLERRAAIVELDPRYVDVIVQRWQEVSGGKAKRAKR